MCCFQKKDVAGLQPRRRSEGSLCYHAGEPKRETCSSDHSGGSGGRDGDHDDSDTGRRIVVVVSVVV